MREAAIERLKMETKNSKIQLEELERVIQEFEKDLAESKEIRRLARLIVSGKLSKEMNR